MLEYKGTGSGYVDVIITTYERKLVSIKFPFNEYDVSFGCIKKIEDNAYDEVLLKDTLIDIDKGLIYERPKEFHMFNSFYMRSQVEQLYLAVFITDGHKTTRDFFKEYPNIQQYNLAWYDTWNERMFRARHCWPNLLNGQYALTSENFNPRYTLK